MCFAGIDPEGITGQPFKGEWVSMLYQNHPLRVLSRALEERDPWGEGVPELRLELLCDSANIKYSHMNHTTKFQSWNLVSGITICSLSLLMNSKESTEEILVCVKNTLDAFYLLLTQSALDMTYASQVLFCVYLSFN